MPSPETKSGLAPIDNARIYYETAGAGAPFLMIHAGVADSRQWENEFAHFARAFQVVRYDMRGYGKSEPVEGEFTNIDDLTGLLDYLAIQEPAILMGCSMGGGLAMDFALEQPARVQALIMVDSGPTGLELDAEEPDAFQEAEEAYKAGDLDKVAEIETQIWFDGMGRSPEDVDPIMRRLAYTMNRNALEQEAKKLGKRLPDAEPPTAEQLAELDIPTLITVGDQDIPYMFAAADYMLEKLPEARKVIMQDAAHLPNMDHPNEFRKIVEEFLEGIGG